MKRPLLYISLSFVIGMYLASVLNSDASFICAAGFFLVSCVMLIRKIKNKSAVLLIICSVSVILGTVRFESTNNAKTKSLYEFSNCLVRVEAEVIDPPVITDKTVTFVGKITSISANNRQKYVDEKVKFTHFLEKDKGTVGLNIPKTGDKIACFAKISVPNGAMNSGGFDYSRYLKSENVFFQAEILLDNAKVTVCDKRSISHRWSDFRQKCIGFFDAVFPGDVNAVLKAFVLGDTSSLTDETQSSFSASGLSHVLAVSGLHVCVFTSMLSALLAFFKGSKRSQRVVSVLGSIFFTLFTGASVSAIRACVMSVAALSAKLIYRKADSMTVLCAVAAVMCAVNPCVIYSVSFMLSFAATAGILLFTESIFAGFVPIVGKLDSEKILHRQVIKILQASSVGIAAQIPVIPLLIWIFNGFSIVSVLSTVLITQLLAPMLGGGMLFCAFSFISSKIAYFIGGFLYLLVKILIGISDFFANLPFSKIILGTLSPFLLLLYGVVIAFFLFALRKDRQKAFASLLSFVCLLAVFSINYINNYNIARVSFINVGQGDCALIKAPGNCDILVDAGGYAQSESTAEFILEPYLLKNGVTDIEYVVLSHLHSDHTVGLLGLLDMMEIKNLIIPYNSIDTDEAQSLIDKAVSKGVKITHFARGDSIRISDELVLSAVMPDEKQYTISDDTNDRCLVMRLDYGEVSFLFTGDITENAEKYAVNYYKKELDADVLKVAHHGSFESTCQEMIDAVSPEFAYIPVGRNTYGHPSQEVIERLTASGCSVYRADVHKDLTFYFDNEKILGIKFPLAK